MPRWTAREGNRDKLITYINEKSFPLSENMDLDPLLDQIGSARVVMLGEASHGTSEFYTWRARISQRLIQAIIWAHNTHVDDARATDMASEGMVNSGQLAREQFGEDTVFLTGFSTHHGTVIAGKQWDAPMEVMGVPDAVEGSWEDILHQAGEQTGMLDRYLITRAAREEMNASEERGHRAIGVVYNPLHERFGNYVPTRLPFRYDALVYIDETQALHPIDIQPLEPVKEPPVPETYRWGL